MQASQERRIHRVRFVPVPCWALVLAYLNAGCSDWSLPAGNRERVPLVVVGEATRDFGTRNQGERLSHTYRLRNVSQNTVIIEDVRTSCGCIAYRMPGKEKRVELAPEGIFELPVEFEIRSAQGVAEGRVLVEYRGISALPGDERPTKRGITLRLRAQVEADYEVSHEVVDFGDLEWDSSGPASAVIDVVPKRLKELAISGLRTSHDCLHAKLLPTEEPTGPQRVRILLDPSKLEKSTRFTGNVVVSTNSEARPQAIIRVQAAPHPAVTVSPWSIVVSSAEEGVVERVLQVVGRRDFRIERVESSSGEVAVSTRSSGAREAQVSVSIEPGNVSSEVVFSLRVSLRNGAAVSRKVRVPVYRIAEGRKDHVASEG